MLKQFFQIVTEGLANAEREFFRASRKSLKESGLLYAPAVVFAYMMAGIKYIFLNFLLIFSELLILIFLPPEEGHKIIAESKMSGYQTAIDGKEDYQKKQKKVRRWTSWTFGTAVAAVAIVSLVLNLVVPLAPESLGATNTFTQTNWGGGSSSNNAIHPTNQSAWSQYSSASSEITAVNGGEDLELVSHSASSTQTTDAQFNGGTFSSATTTGSGASASVKLSKALHINEYTIGALSNISVTASSVTVNSNGTWTIAFSGTPSLSRIFKNDKFTDSASKAWKVLSVAPDVYKIIVVDSEGNIPTVSAPATGSGTVGRWYASIFAWEAGRQGDITATGRNAIERGLPYYDGAADTVAVAIDGWTTDATHYIEIYVPLSERHRGKWDDNKYRIERTNSSAFAIQEEYVRIDGLQMKLTSTGTQSGQKLTYSAVNNTNSDIRISNNIIKADLTGVTSGYVFGISQNWNIITNWKIWNNIFYNFSGGGSDGSTSAIYINDGGNAYVYNNTIVNSRIGINKSNPATVVAKNNIVQGSVDGFLNIGGTSDYNISDLAGDAPGANSKNSTVVPFVDPSAGDFHLEFRDGTGNPAMNAGADLSADANLAFTTDIDGDTRSGTWDIGADDVGATLVMPHSIGATSRDFSTLQAWEDARDGNLTANQRKVFRATQQAAFAERETVTGASSTATGVYIKEEATPKSSLKGNYSNGNQFQDVAVSGNYAYVADFSSTFKVVDVSNPASPTLAGSVSLVGGNTYNVAVSGSYAYVADGASGLKIVNISSPTSPTLTGTYDTPQVATSVAVSGNYAYVTDYDTGASSTLQIIDISTPSSPTLAGSYSMTQPWDVVVSGNYAYVADSGAGLQIINISSSTAPTFAGVYNTPSSTEGIYLSGNYAYIADGASGLQIINISSSTAPTLAGAYNTPDSANDVFVSGNYAYVADGTQGGLQVINVASSTAPTFAGNYPTSAYARGVYVSNGYAYVADDTSGLRVIKPLEYFTLEGGSGTFQVGETVVGATSGATSTIGAILTTQGTIEKGEAYKDSTFTAGLGIDGSTTDANHYMWLTAEPGSRHRGVAGTGAKIDASGLNTGIGVQDDFTVIEWLEIYDSTPTSSLVTYGIKEAYNSTYRHLIVHDVGTGGTVPANTACYTGWGGLDTIGTSEIYNSVFYNCNGQGVQLVRHANLYNTVVYNNSQYGVMSYETWDTTNNYEGKNIIAVGNNTGGSTGDFEAAIFDSSSNNISSDATAPGAGSLTNKNVSDLRFVSTASDFVDLHILDGSVAKDAGADLSATFNTDVDGQTRPNGSAFDAGADEWFSSSPVYNTAGTFTSGTIDLGNPVNFDTLTWNPTSTQPVSGSLKFAIAAKSADSGWQDSDFIDLNQEAYPSGVTVHTSYIRPTGDCTGYSPCYNSLATWESAQRRDLTASNEIEVAQIGGNWTSPDTTAVNINGWTVDATHYVKIYTAPEARHNGKWDNTKYRLEASVGSPINNWIDYLRIDGLQIKSIYNLGNPRGILSRASAGAVYISNNIIASIAATTLQTVGIDFASGGSHYVWNNIVYGFSNNASSAGIRSSSNVVNISYIYNNTVYGNDVGIINGGTIRPVLKNNISYNNTDNYGGTFATDSVNNLSGPGADSGIPSVSARNGVSVTFIDSIASDYRLASSDTGARNYGTSSVSEIGFATDIEGHLRSSSSAGGSWDIGAHEYGATGGAVPASLDNNRYIRYKAYFSTADSAFSPQMDDLTVNYTYYATSGVYLASSPYNTNDSTNILGKVAWTATTTGGATVKIQVRSAPNNSGVPGVWSSWCGPITCNDSENDSDNFTASANNVDLPSNHPLKNGGNDQWLQYKIKLNSTGASTPTFGNIVLTYVVNAPPDLQNVTASQRTSDGKVDVVYEVRDTDTATGTTTPGLITPSFSYSTDGGQNWTAITSGYLSAGNLSNKQVCDGTGTYGLNCATTQYTQYTATWDAKAQLNGTYATNTKIMITATDNEGANNSSSVATSAFTLDVKNPVATVVVDGTKDGQAGAIATSISDNSSAQMMLSNRSDYAADGLNGSSGSWIATSTSLTWTFASGEPVRVYGKVKDVYQNELAVAPDAPNTPINVTVQDISNLALSQFSEFVSWGVSTASDFVSYKGYQSTNGTSYNLISTITNVAINYRVYGNADDGWLSNGTTYYYKMTAQDSSGNISRYSSVVSDIPDGQGGTDVTPPTISGLTSSNINTTQATITWTTDELSNSVVYYSADSSYSSSKSVASMVTAHSATLTGLTPNTAYNFRVRSTDPLGNVSSYATGTPFTTAQGAVISGVVVVSASGNSAEIVWNTNANSDSWVIYSLNSDLSGSQTAGTSTLVGGSGPNYEHRVSLSSLSTNAKYYFKVRSVDGSSNSAEDDNGGSYYTFTTAQDVSAPVISSVSAILSSQTSTVISWLTNEPADSRVVYGLDQNSLTSQTSVNSTMTINHSMILSDLTAGATYYYKVVSADSSANSTQSAVYNFSTTAIALQETLVIIRYVESGPPADKTSPLITEVKVDDITESEATVTWRTDEEADSFVEYGPPDILGFTRGQRESVKPHRVVLMDLKPNARYSFKATSADASGNVSVSLVVNFQTLSPKTVAEKIGDQIEQSAREKIKDFKIENQDDIARLTKEIENIIAEVSAKVAPPKITGAEPKVEVSSSFAVISWVTDRPANSIVAYAGDGDYKSNADEPYQSTAGNPDEQVTEHNVALSNLAPGTTYHFQVRSKGLIGGAGKSADFSFKTGEEAAISGIEIKDITKNSAAIFWRTNLPATTLLEYGRSVDYGQTQTDASMNTSHTITLKNLQPGTLYHFRVGGIDKNNKSFYSPDLNFITEALPSLLNVKIDSVKEREMTVTWFTDVISDSTVEYTNGITKKTEAASDKQFVKNHTMTITGLDENVPYSLKVISKDEKGNEVKSSEYNLQTAKDVQPPAITNIQTQSAVSSRDKVQTIVSWRTVEPATSRVVYQEGAIINPAMEKSSPLNSDFKTNHVVVFTNFKPGAVYRLRIESVDGSGNISSSKDITILTPQKQETVIDLIIKNFQDVFKWTEKIR